MLLGTCIWRLPLVELGSGVHIQKAEEETVYLSEHDGTDKRTTAWLVATRRRLSDMVPLL